MVHSVDWEHSHMHKFSDFYLLYQVLRALSIINHGNLIVTGKLRSCTFNRIYVMF